MSSWTDILPLAAFLFAASGIFKVFVTLVSEDLKRAHYSGGAMAPLWIFFVGGSVLILVIEAQLILWWWGP